MKSYCIGRTVFGHISAMGGMSGEVRGKSKIDAYLHYLRETEGYEDWTSLPNPRHKKACKREMVWDPEAEEWVLHYHLHS